MDSSCSKCIQGTIHDGLPIGNEETLHGLKTYIVGNRTNPRGIIVIYTDVFGLLLPNNKLIADGYAKSGEWLVYMPDFFKGDPVPLKLADVLIPVDATKQSGFGKFTGLLSNGPGFLVWLTRHKQGPTDKICTDFLRELRKSTGLKIGMVGFCWGGKYAIRSGLEGNKIEKNGRKVPLVDAIVALHPSHLAVPVDVEELAVPVSYGWGLEDSEVSIDQKSKVEETHAKAARGGKKVPEMEHRIYKPGRHGFAVRGNPDDPLERACLEDSEKQVLTWFGRWLS